MSRRSITRWWRRLRSRLSRVALVPVDEPVLARLVGAAVADATPDEVTPPVASGKRWTPERIEWLRRFHRDRRIGLDGPLGEASWAVTAGGDVVGAVRLKRTTDPAVLETGIWLTRGARGRGIGRRAMAAVLAEARRHGARQVRADTSPENVAALAVLAALGFDCERRDDRITAVRAVAP
jgi:RimJ/RimL family protein N-acetyltransferase